MDNKLNESEWDMPLLNEELETLTDLSMDMFGFTLEQVADEMLDVEPVVPFTEILNEENNYIVLKFDNKIDWINAMGLLGIKSVKKYPTKRGKQDKQWEKRSGVGRVIDGIEAMERMKANEL